MRDVPLWLRLVALMVIVLAVAVRPGDASAHTGLEFSDPADGETVTQPVTEVSVGFTSEVELVGDGFEALDPQGNLREPSVISDDDRVFTLLFDPPLTGGGVGIRFEVRAPDGHVLSDSFSFVVDAPVSTPAPPSTSEPVSTPAPPTSEPGGGPATAAPESELAAPGSTTSVAPTTTAAPTTAGTSTTAATVDAASGGSGTGIVLAIAAAAAIGIGGFFLIRSRTSGAS